MSLLVSKVPRSLEMRTKLFGFELADLLFIFLYLAVSNLIFGQTRLKFPMVWLGTVGIAAALHFLKRGKPENHLQHAGEFHWSSGVYSAGSPDLDYRPYSPARTSNEELNDGQN